MSLCVVRNATFQIKHSKSKGMQEKESNIVFGADRKFRPSGSILHHEARNFLSAPHTHVRFLIMVIASHIHAITGMWCHEGLLWECICTDKSVHVHTWTHLLTPIMYSGVTDICLIHLKTQGNYGAMVIVFHMNIFVNCILNWILNQ